MKRKIETDGFVSTVMKRKQFVNKDKSYVGLNALIQGSAAEIMKLGLINVDRLIRRYDAVPLLLVHDEIVVEVPEQHAEKVAELVREGLTSAFELDPPLAVDGGIVQGSYAEA